MAESTLSLTIADLAREVGGYLGFGRTASNWTGWNPSAPYVPQSGLVNGMTVGADDTQLAWIMECVESGLRQFYDPPPVQGFGPYRWSFLRPEATLAITTNVGEYDLPDPFGGLIGTMNYQPSANSPYGVRPTGIEEVRRTLQRLVSTVGKPVLVAIVPKQTDGSSGQRFRAVFAPTPDASYTLGYRFQVQPEALTARYPYPFGGPKHGETLKESCLAIAESRFQGEQTIHEERFLERLKASLALDMKDSTPDTLGMNLNRRSYSSRWPGENRHDYDNDLMTFNGVVPG